VGSGPLDAELQASARALRIDAKVTFTGPVSNNQLAERYRRATLLVVPSVVADDGDQEGLGLVIAEALACECPVVASDLAAIGDLIQDGTTGLLARQADAEDLARKILQVLRDPTYGRELARRGRDMVLERFDWQQVSRGYEELLAAVVRYPT
jgi:glycosyltransferase involved in cell wall biosynthesis